MKAADSKSFIDRADTTRGFTETARSHGRVSIWRFWDLQRRQAKEFSAGASNPFLEETAFADSQPIEVKTMKSRHRNTVSMAMVFAALLSIAVTFPAGICAEPKSGEEGSKVSKTHSPPNAAGGGETDLMRAAAQNNFEELKKLLWAGARADGKDAHGHTALDFVKTNQDASTPVSLLLQCYSYMEAHGEIATGPVRRPTLVMLLEPTVDYNNEEIKHAYYVNQAELHGKPGEDNDHNGFVNDVYGWNVATNSPHTFNNIQGDNPADYQQLVKSLFKVNDEEEEGDLSAEADMDELDNTFSNPLFEQFGPESIFSDKAYLDLLLNLSHGTHVAGIVLKNSRNTASLHTLSWMPFQKYTKPESSRRDFIDALIGSSSSMDDFIEQYRLEILNEALGSGKIASRYLKATGAGVVNMSFGSEQSAAITEAQRIIAEFISSKGEKAGAALLRRVNDRYLAKLALQLYAAEAIEQVIPMYENPDILFVAAAGNDGSNNDDTLQGPAYLSRFFPNVITVAAVDDDGNLASFSNFGRYSVNIGAPGVCIRSCAISNQTAEMSGTSMAAPAVSGLACYLRYLNPKLTAPELRQIIEQTASPNASLSGKVSSGGNLDPEAAIASASR